MSSLPLAQSSERDKSITKDHSVDQLLANATLSEEPDQLDFDRSSQRSIPLSSPTKSTHLSRESLNWFIRELGQHDNESTLAAVPLESRYNRLRVLPAEPALLL